MIEAALAEIARRIEQNKLYLFLPYGHPDTLSPHGAIWADRNSAGVWHNWSNKPWQYDFLNSQTSANALFAGNRLGKSEVGAVRAAFHATGYYPDWYRGRRYKGNITVWCCAISSEFSRDVQQQKLLGDSDCNSELYGTGYIPRGCIIDKPKYRQAGVSDTIDYIATRRLDGGTAKTFFKSYDQGWRKFGGRDVHHCWMDEQPDENNLKEKRIFSEICARAWAVGGTLDMTMTPLLSAQDMVRAVKASPDASVFSASIFDVPHMNDLARQRAIDSVPEHERACRIYGVEMVGTGRVFMTNDSDIIVKPFEIPAHYARIAGADFGIDHPAAGAWCCWDRDSDIFYVYDIYKASNKTSLYHAEMFKSRGLWIPVAWPHDGLRRGRADGLTFADEYRKHGVRMLSLSARYKTAIGGPQPVEPIFDEINERMLTGRWKVFSTCTEWFDEYRGMHRDDNGKIVDRRDDAVKASIYAYMMRRYAISSNIANSSNVHSITVGRMM